MSAFRFDRLSIGHIHALAENKFDRVLEVLADLYDGDLFALPYEHLTPLVTQFGEELKAHMLGQPPLDEHLIRRMLGGAK